MCQLFNYKLFNNISIGLICFLRSMNIRRNASIFQFRLRIYSTKGFSVDLLMDTVGAFQLVIYVGEIK